MGVSPAPRSGRTRPNGLKARNHHLLSIWPMKGALSFLCRTPWPELAQRLREIVIAGPIVLAFLPARAVDQFCKEWSERLVRR